MSPLDLGDEVFVDYKRNKKVIVEWVKQIREKSGKLAELVLKADTHQNYNLHKSACRHFASGECTCGASARIDTAREVQHLLGSQK